MYEFLYFDIIFSYKKGLSNLEISWWVFKIVTELLADENKIGLNYQLTKYKCCVILKISIISILSMSDTDSLLPVGWGCRIHWLHLCRGVRPPPNECLGYDTKQSDGEVPVMLGPWGILSTPSLPLLPGPLRPGMVAPDRALSMG